MNTLPQPSIKSLLLSCLASIFLAAVLLLFVVLPAEFNIDPTGLGKKMGLTQLSQTSASSKATVVSCPEPNNTANHDHDHEHEHEHQSNSITEEANTSIWQDSVLITVPPMKGLEYKFHINKGESLEFVWKTDGTPLYFDFHGDPEGAKNGYFKSYKESSAEQSSGTLLAPFTGAHGWYWKNKTNKTISIHLKSRGKYKIIGLL